MRYKPLFRVLVKVIGVYLIATAIVSILSEIVRALMALAFSTPHAMFATWLQDTGLLGWVSMSLLPNLIQIAIGLLLFFRSNWIANLAIPGNRIYCPECGYDMHHTRNPHCPECGTVQPTGDPTRPGSDSNNFTST